MYESGHVVDIREDASATFLGKLVAKDVDNVASVFSNAGSLE